MQPYVPYIIFIPISWKIMNILILSANDGIMVLSVKSIISYNFYSFFKLNQLFINGLPVCGL